MVETAVLIGEVRLAPDRRAPGLARRAVEDWLGDGHPALDTVVLAVSELVTNAVEHAEVDRPGAVIGVELAQGDGYLRLSVTDPGSSRSHPSPVPLREGLGEECGRGLAIVRALSGDRWGSRRTTGGRLVWCHLDALG